MLGLTSSAFLMFISQFGVSLQACRECVCCKNGPNFCDSNKNCIDGCQAGYYGQKCTEQCMENCKNCVNGYECTECKPGYYTSNCNLQCGKGCVNNTCMLSGECLCKSTYFTKGKCDACLGLRYGDECNKNCPSNCGSCISDTECSWCKNTGFYGSYCQYNCSVGCVNGRCHKGTGHCISGCKPGFFGEFCNNTCKYGTYGENCSKSCLEIDQHCLSCSTNESGSYGNCTECERGYYAVIPFGYDLPICVSCPLNCKDKACDTAGMCYNGCVRGKWGKNCNTNCNTNCVECDQNNGTCLECSTDTFAYNCTQQCSTNCKNASNDRICAMENGRCLQGCKLSTIYGEFCEIQCSDTCNNKSCDFKSGHCTEGCAMNYYGSFCDKKCSDACQSNENKRVCDDENGNCLYGCKPGFRGKRCNSMCDNRCLNTTCNQITGNCLHGCIQGFKGPKCVEAIQPGQEGHTTGTLIGSIVGSLVAGGIIVGVAGLVVFIVWKRRHGHDKQADKHGYKNTPVPGENCSNDNSYDSDFPVTYEDLRSHDERLYSQMATGQGYYHQ